MPSWSLLLGLLFVLQPKPVPAAPVPDSAADTVTLRDGTVVLGQIAEAPPRGMFLMYVRRAWAEATLPEQAKRWEAATAVELKRAYQARRDRLAAWKRERVKPAGPDDPIGRWLDQELDRDSKRRATRRRRPFWSWGFGAWRSRASCGGRRRAPGCSARVGSRGSATSRP